MSLKRYAYAKREWEQRRFYLDYNEYMGRIHPSIGDDFNLERLTRHYAFGSAPAMAEHLVTSLGYNAPGFCTHGADEGLFHTLLWFRLRWDPVKRRRFPRLAVQHAATYDHVLTFAAGLGYDVLTPENADAVTADVHYLCSPNNPTGDLVELAPSSAELLIIDRTYDDYMANDTKRTDLEKLNSVLIGEKPIAVVKSFAKAFPIAGFRLGLVATNDSDLQSYFHNVYNQKLVTDAALTVAKHCLDHGPFYEVERRSIFEARTVIASELQPLIGDLGLNIEVPPGGNFIVTRGSAASLQAASARLKNVGVSIRLKEAAGLARVTSVSEAFLGELFERFALLKKEGPSAEV